MRRALILLAVISASSANAEDWAIEAFLGGNHQGTLMWGGIDYELKDGTTFGVSVYRQGPSNLEFGLEIARANNDWVGFPNEEQLGTSLMANGRYLFPLGELFQGYVGAGIGAVRVGYDDAGDIESDNTVGGQIMLGGRYTLPNTGLQGFAELRYLDTFEDARLPSGNDVEYRRTDLVIGVRRGF